MAPNHAIGRLKFRSISVPSRSIIVSSWFMMRKEKQSWLCGPPSKRPINIRWKNSSARKHLDDCTCINYFHVCFLSERRPPLFLLRWFQLLVLQLPLRGGGGRSAGGTNTCSVRYKWTDPWKKRNLWKMLKLGKLVESKKDVSWLSLTVC